MASVLAVTPMITGLPQLSAPAKAHPVKSQTRQVGFASTSVAAMRANKNATRSAPDEDGAPDPMVSARSGAVTAAQNVSGEVTVVGVTWPKGAVTAKDHFQIRTLTGSTWSQWTSLHVDQADGPDAKEAAAASATGGSSPYIVTGASKYELRSLTADPSAPLAAKVQVVNPGTSDADTLQAAPGGASAASAKPTVYPRATWGANESLRKGTPSYGKIALGFVHHTDSANNYTAANVPAMIRGMYAYHVQSLGWSDIGYNFLVDRFGRTWEGRFGGMDKPVVGAQTMNYNSVSTGVSAIGNFETTGVPAAMTASFKRILAWKLSLAGVPATGNVPTPRPPSWSTAPYFQRISGHRAGFQTACPGRYLNAQLPAIRTGAAAIIAAAPPTPPVVVPPPVVVQTPVIRSVINRDVDRNGALDALSYKPGLPGRPIVGATSLLASAPRNPVSSGVAIGTGWNGMRNASVSKDLTGDGKADIIAQDRAANNLRIYRGNGTGGFAGYVTLGRGWNGMNRLLAAGDRDKDGRNDILSTSTTGDLMFYRGTGTGAVRPGRVIGRGWTSLSSITSAGDLTGDGFPDLLATRTSDGVQLMYAGTSTGSLRTAVAWGSGWGAFSTVAGGSDLDGDRYPDVFARVGSAMTTRSSDASGRLVRSIRWGRGWGTFNQLSTGADWNGDGVADLLAVNPALGGGTMNLYRGTGKRDFATRVAAFPTVAGADLVKLVGDVNGDGYPDAVARVRTSNTLVLLRGMAGSRFGTPVRIGTGWNALTLIEAAGDYNGDGVPDLLARDAAGNLSVYPFTRSLTFKARITVGTGFQGMTSVIGTGAINQDAFGDVVSLRASDHALVLFSGTGFRGLVSASTMAAAQNDLAQLLGVGDYNGDGKADVMARSTSGRLWLYPGNGLGKLSTREPVRGGQGAGHVLG